MNSQTPGKILIADDNPDNLRVINEQLGDSNYEIRVARDGFGALESIQADTPDLILLDILMPRMDGYELCRRLKKDERYKDIPIIFITALDESFNKVKGFQIGAVDYIVKPFEIEEVKARVKTHIEYYMYQRELKELHKELEQRVVERTKELKKSEAILRGFVDGSRDAICIRDRDRRLVMWNEAFANSVKTNCGVDVQVGMRAEDYISEELFAQFGEQRKQLYLAIEGELTQTEYAYPCKDDEIRYFDVRWTPVYLEDEIFGIAEVSRDVTEQKIAKEELRRSDEKFRGYMQASMEAIWGFEIEPPMPMDLTIDAQLDFLYDHARISIANNAWAKQTGYDRWEDMIGLRLDEIVPRSAPENVAAIKRIAEANYHLENFITQDINEAGELQAVLNTLSAEIKDGHLIRTWGTHRDISEQEAARKELREAEKRYRTVADFTYDWEYWESPEGKILYISPSCERITGYSTEEFLNDPELMQKIIPPEDRSIWKDHQHKAMKKSELLEIQFRIRTKDGEIRWIEHACQPVYDTDGTYLGIRASNRDISERKLAENELREKDKMLEDAQRIARLGSWNWNIIKNELVWSDEVYRIFGLSPQEFGATYEAFLERIHPDDRKNVKEAVNRALADPSSEYNIMHRIVTSEGIERMVRERGNVTFDDKGKAIRMIGTVQDITDIKIMEAETQKLRSELAHLDRSGMMGVLTAGIAHEINQPLAAILSNAQAALRFLTGERPDLDEVREALRDIVSDDKRAGEMVHSIRNIMGRSELKKEELDFNETIREVLVLIKSELLNRKVFLSENLQPDIPKIYGHHIQIQQVILNLLMNSLEALGENGETTSEIIISSQVEENQGVVLSVSDSGPGIKPDLLVSIFDSFYTTKAGGMGVGLSICRTIIEDHGGTIWAENRPEGGAVFFFKLPFGENRDE